MGIKFITFGQLPAVEITAPDGASAIVTLFGAHLVSWKPRDGREQMFCSAKAALDGSKAIRGGVPLIFPQFNQRGDGMRHGFARLSPWELLHGGAGNGGESAQFRLNSAGNYSAQWPFAFSLLYTVRIEDQHLALTLAVNNLDTKPFSFSTALHSYLRIDDPASLAISGLQSARYSESAKDTGIQTWPLLSNPGKIDRIYHDVGTDLEMTSGARRMALHLEGFNDVVIWNPGVTTDEIADLASEEFREFICIEPAVIEPYVLEPGTQWSGRHVLQCG